LQYQFTDFFTFHFSGLGELGREEEVEAIVLEDLDAAGLKDTTDGRGQDSEEEEGHEDGAGLYDEGVGVTGLLQDPHPHTDVGVATSFILL
jgi:hypothetical protein